MAQSPLSDADLAALLNWLIGEFGEKRTPDGFVPYTGDEVAAYRVDPIVDVSAAREALVRQFGNGG